MREAVGERVEERAAEGDRLFCRSLLQKRRMILRSLLIIATPYLHDQSWIPLKNARCVLSTLIVPSSL